jgi:protein SCO1/2
MKHLHRRELGALGALLTILAITAAWWALALWPLPGDAATWVVRTRAVCFGAVVNGLPTTAGWMVLIGQPVYMLAALWLISGQSVSSALKSLWLFPAGRGLLTAMALLAVMSVSGAAVRVARATTVGRLERTLTAGAPLAAGHVPRLNQTPPLLALFDQRGERVTLARFRGRPVLVVFAFAHCATVCPLIVHDALAAQAAAAERSPIVLIVTLDPWRDTPARLPAIAAQWKLGPDAYVASAAVSDVERTLDAWSVGRARDPRTGDVVHTAQVYVIDGAGRIAFSMPGADVETLARLVERL